MRKSLFLVGAIFCFSGPAGAQDATTKGPINDGSTLSPMIADPSAPVAAGSLVVPASNSAALSGTPAPTTGETIRTDGLIDGDAAQSAIDAANSVMPDGSVPFADPAVLAALPTSDPELAAMVRAASTIAAAPLTWDETASKDFYNSVLHLEWQNTLGDYIPTVLGTAPVPLLSKRFTVSIPVTPANDFYVLHASTGSSANFDSRIASSSYRPTLIVNGTTKYVATRNVALSPSLSGSIGLQTIMKDSNAMLFGFDNYKPVATDKVTLNLVTEKQYGSHTLAVYQTNVSPAFPLIDAVADSTVVADFHGSNFKTSSTVSVTNDIVTGFLQGKSGTALGQLFTVPPAQEYFMTVVIKLENDWASYAGKLPGLSNTGQATNTGGVPRTINGINCDNGGWGGRNANGCRWSARTGWGGRKGNLVGLQTYFYAQAPINGYGWVQHWPTPAPVGQWFAYVQRVRVNTPGQADGRLSYWMCTQAGCNPQFDRKDIVWRTADLPEALISEAWADVYCGGTGCPPPGPWPRSTVDLKRMTVTTGLPDMPALLAEVQAMTAM